MGLRKYFSKRKFAKTPEPKGRIHPQHHKKLRFVVQKHHASQLHYDFRLELDGVLKSWAVPKGPSMDPHDRHLAMMVEDHPFEYRTFEGVIPEGNYGAGEVIIWDQGTYEPRAEHDDPQKLLRQQLRKGHLTFVLHGEKLHGEFALIKMQGVEENAWLLVKKDDKFASAKDITNNEASVVSGKTVDELAPTELGDYPKAKMPRHVTPMLCTLVNDPFNREGWLFEMKWDGYRAIAAKSKETLELYSRNQLDFTQRFPEVVEAIRNLNDDIVVDGEIVIVDNEGKPRFELLQNWRRNQIGTIRYYIFDIIWYNGKELTNMPLLARKELLRSVIPKDSLLYYSDHVEEQGEKLFRQVQKQGLEGIIAKKADSPYAAGVRSPNWLKIKTHLRQEVVIGGFTEGRGTRQYIGALLLGVYENGELHFIGHSNAGLPDQDRKLLRQKLDKLERQSSAFASEPKPNGIVHWVSPKLVGEVVFSEWTKEGMMRQPEFKGLRPDKEAKSVHHEKAKKAAKVISQASTSSTMHVQLQQNKELFTHLDKVFWPERGYTKGDLIAYYNAVGKTVLPYLKDRPISLLRQPGGYKDRGFFQKNITFHVPSFVHTTTIHSESTQEDVHYMVCKNIETLLFIAQLGSIEVNPWSSRVGKLTKPDWAVIDLDPEGVTFKDVVTVAKTVHEVCSEWKVPHYPKTSGKTGIHIFIPTGARYSYEQVRNFAHLIVLEVNKRQPKLTSVERNPEKRRHKVYLDFLQNSEGQTLAAPYSVRPTKDASVSAPLHWDEVTLSLRPEQFTLKNMPERIAKVGDLWKPIVGKGVDLKKLLDKLS